MTKPKIIIKIESKSEEFSNPRVVDICFDGT
jgi:hypothetical protein